MKSDSEGNEVNVNMHIKKKQEIVKLKKQYEKEDQQESKQREVYLVQQKLLIDEQSNQLNEQIQIKQKKQKENQQIQMNNVGFNKRMVSNKSIKSIKTKPDNN